MNCHTGRISTTRRQLLLTGLATWGLGACGGGAGAGRQHADPGLIGAAARQNLVALTY